MSGANAIDIPRVPRNIDRIDARWFSAIGRNLGGKPTAVGLLGISAAYILLALCYSWATPPLEAGDENLHFYAIRQIAAGRGLPVLDPAENTRPDSPHQEAGSAPLYHLIAALAIRDLSTDDVLSYSPNPHAFIGSPSTDTPNRNRVIHPAEESALQSVAALQRARLVSVGFGLMAVLATFFLARKVAPGQPAIASLAAGLIAFNPMFLFVSASVANDSAIAALSTFALLTLRSIVRGELSWPRTALQGLVIGAACLTKVSGLGLIPLAVGAILYEAQRCDRWHVGVQRCLLLLATVAAVAGWWYVRNLILYGDPTAIGAWLAVSGARDRPFDPGELQGIWVGFWGIFGAFDILAQPWTYVIFAAICVAAAAGWVGALITGEPLPFERAALAMLAVWVGIEALALARWTSLTLASSGRLLFPAISAIAILIAIGFLFALRPRRRPAAAVACTVGLAAIASLIPPLSLVPAYRPAPMASEADIASAAVRPRTTFGDVMMLEGARIAPTAASGQPVQVELVWRALKPTPLNYSVSVHLLGRDGGRVGQLDVYPGAGRYPTSLWKPGELIKDELKVPVWAPVDSPTGARVAVTVYDLNTQNNLQAKSPEGADIYPVILGASELGAGSEGRCKDGIQDGLFDGRVRLVSVSPWPEVVAPGATVNVNLVWCLVARPNPDYSVFVHLTQVDRSPIAQHDGPPRGGAYPMSAWARGELVTDMHSFAVPPPAAPSAYRLLVGLYDPTTGSRLKTQTGREFVDLGPLIVRSGQRIFSDLTG